LINGLSQSKLKCAFKDDVLILVEGDQVGSGALGYYYGLPNFILMDPKTGFKDIIDVETLESHVDHEKIDSTSLILWLTKHKDATALRKYMIEHLDGMLNKNALTGDGKTGQNIINFDPSNKEKCLTFLRESEDKNIPFTNSHIINIFKQCMPRIENADLNDPEYKIKYWLKDLLNIENF
jgi:hypothetical protein